MSQTSDLLTSSQLSYVLQLAGTEGLLDADDFRSSENHEVMDDGISDSQLVAFAEETERSLQATSLPFVHGIHYTLN